MEDVYVTHWCIEAAKEYKRAEELALDNVVLTRRLQEAEARAEAAETTVARLREQVVGSLRRATTDAAHLPVSPDYAENVARFLLAGINRSLELLDPAALADPKEGL